MEKKKYIFRQDWMFATMSATSKVSLTMQTTCITPSIHAIDSSNHWALASLNFTKKALTPL